MLKPTEFEFCPKCKKNTATSMANPDGSGRFYCTTKHCGFEVPTQKQDMAKAMDKLADIKKKMFPS
ncbi:hypothetical protein [Marinagarivorans cellulosilyticus]|uniref:hypothetical protein n=1 Tax=Marinagarivorans cellulosilyticus TaxID=2721545 RepID=UPI001F32DB62|nr:hypothetical protein [Marinagarivorans cellulosilyticus]